MLCHFLTLFSLHTTIYFTMDMCPGGLDLKSQEAALRLSPDIVIATPGRLIDHLRNTPTFSILSVEILVLDEADRYTMPVHYTGWYTGIV